MFEDKYGKEKKYCNDRGYCHYTGEYRGAVHSICNLAYPYMYTYPWSTKYLNMYLVGHDLIANNLAEGIHKIKCKYRHNNKNCKTYWIKYKDSECCLEYTRYEDDSIESKCLCWNKNFQKSLMKT